MTPEWVENFPGAITICDANLIITYMNEKALSTWQSQGGRQLIGSSLLACHQNRSNEIIKKLLESGGTNVYTIQKNGVKKLIYQTAWQDSQGKVAGLAELSLVIPEDLPHFVRG
jgi:methylmalonyl-CoA mutase cobalamin-binding subunit